MKSRIKIIVYFLLELVLSLLVLGVTGIVLLKTTIYNPNYLKEQFEESNYYENLSQTIYDNMSENIYQASLDESVLENLYTKEDLEKAINEMIKSVYEGKEYKVDTSEVKEKLENNVSAYLSKHNMEITNQTSLDEFVNTILSIYQREITLSNGINMLTKIVSKTNKIVNISLIICLILIVILTIFIKHYYEDATLAVPFILTSIVLMFIFIYFNSNLIVNQIYLFDTKITSLIQQILNHALTKLKVYSIVTFIIGIICAIIDYFMNPSNKKESKKSKKEIKDTKKATK